MLIQFTVENYRSFSSPAVLSMVATPIVSRASVDEGNTVRTAEDLKLLKAVAIYGPNAGGKSNLIQALRFMRDFVLNSSRDTQAGDPIGVEPFLLDEGTAARPSSFELVFLIGGMEHRYGFEAEPSRVTAEWLYRQGDDGEQTLFERELQTFVVGEELREEAAGITARTRDNALLLSVLAQFNGKLAGRVLGWFRDLRCMSGLDDQQARDHTLKRFQVPRWRAAIVGFVRRLDLGIQDIVVTYDRPPPDEPGEDADEKARFEYFLRSSLTRPTAIRTLHRRVDATGATAGVVELDMARHESQGTQKLFAVAGPLIEALQSGHVVVIDEFDARLHPTLTRELVKLFHSKDTNPRDAQLVFATHDTNLLDPDLLRRDQVWFVEKDRGGASHLYSLAEYKVRDEAFERNYIEGRYGAIPFVGGLRWVLGAPHE